MSSLFSVMLVSSVLLHFWGNPLVDDFFQSRWLPLFLDLVQKGRAAEAEAEFEKLLGGLHVKSAIAELLKLERGEEVDAVKLSDLFFGHYFRGNMLNY